MQFFSSNLNYHFKIEKYRDILLRLRAKQIEHYSLREFVIHNFEYNRKFDQINCVRWIVYLSCDCHYSCVREVCTKINWNLFTLGASFLTQFYRFITGDNINYVKTD